MHACYLLISEIIGVIILLSVILRVTDAIIKVLSSVSKAIKSVKCPIVGDYYADGELVLMRCEHSDTPINIHNCSHILDVQCGE